MGNESGPGGRDSRPSPDPPPQQTETTLDLVRLAKAGDTEALGRLYTRYTPRLIRWAHRRLPHSARGVMETSDLVNDTFRRIIPALERFEPQSEGAFQLFIRRALMNRIADVWRATRRRPQEELGDAHADTGPSPLERAVGREALEGYERALSVLDAEHQQAIVLRFEMGLGFSEIAEALGKPSPDAARMTVSRGVKRLIQEMGGAGF